VCIAQKIHSVALLLLRGTSSYNSEGGVVLAGNRSWLLGGGKACARVERPPPIPSKPVGSSQLNPFASSLCMTYILCMHMLNIHMLHVHELYIHVIYIYTYMDTCTCIYIFIDICIYVYIYTYVYIYVYI